MKQLLTILLILSCFAVSAQNGNDKKYPADFNTYGVHYPRGAFDSAMHIPVLKDTVSVRDNSRYKDSAELAIFQGELWYKLPKGYWKKAGNGNGNGNVDLSNYYPKSVVDSLLNFRTATTVTAIRRSNPYMGYTVNTNRPVGVQFVDNGDGTVSIQTAFLDGGTVINVTPGALKTTEGQTIQTTEGQTIIFN